MDAPDLNLDGPGFAVESIVPSQDLAIIAVTPTAGTADCPLCGRPSGRVHGRYTRTLADLPRHGRAVVLVLHARRFRRADPECVRAIFCERPVGLAAAHARSTARLARLHLALGLALGGEPGARPAGRMGIAVSADTLLRRVGGLADGPIPAPRCIAVGPSQPQSTPQTATTATSTSRCLRFRACRGWLSDSKYDPIAPTSTCFAMTAAPPRAPSGSTRDVQGPEPDGPHDRSRSPLAALYRPGTWVTGVRRHG